MALNNNKKIKMLNKKQIVFLIVVIPLLITFGNSFPLSLDFYSNLSDEHKHLWTAIVVSAIGITIHLAKKKTQDKEMCMIGELFELLMFMLIPATTSFEVLKNEIQQQPLIITCIFLSVLFAWFLISLHLIHKSFHDKGKIIRRYVMNFYFTLTGFGVLMTFFIMYLQSFVPK